MPLIYHPRMRATENATVFKVQVTTVSSHMHRSVLVWAKECLHNATTSSSVTTARVHRVVHPFELPPDAKHWLVVATDQGDPYRDVHWRCARISDSILMR
ncbi:hypothetical protein PC113_g17818 [Phytophthora cactorum]|uniref:Uncharacterized protein n=1 Tax=Phytophthora cactorum TaxID=29920 RepID=A0A8T1B5K0_9STRA|nr:hypothetical protein PC113_g17818 [Phytophthora cactorum]KAG2896990.1 hypothetical protein PC115_g17361 [Phytophthora cactorum]